MSRFYFGDSDSDDSTGAGSLPYPKPLARSAFLTPGFSPTEFLSSLQNRHQTLEDLTVELRTRDQELNKELLDLVNDNYQDFLSLGSSLRGGDEKIEEVRLGLLRFLRDIESLKGNVTKHRAEAQELLAERKQLWIEARKGKWLLEVDTKLEALEHALKLNDDSRNILNGNVSDENFTESGDSDEDYEDVAGCTISVGRLGRRVQQFVSMKRLAGKIGQSHPFILKQKDRASKIRQTLLLDLSNGIAERQKLKQQDYSGILKILSMYQDLDAAEDLLSAMKRANKKEP